MQPYVGGFVRRFFELGLTGLVIACLDEFALQACLKERNSGGAGTGFESEYPNGFVCLDSQEGHVIYNKHRWLPILLSAHIDVLWLDFDIYMFRDPVKHIKSLKPAPGRRGMLDYEIQRKAAPPSRHIFPGAAGSRSVDEPDGFDGDLLDEFATPETTKDKPLSGLEYMRAQTKRSYREIRSRDKYVPLRDPVYDPVPESAPVQEEDLPDIYVTEHYDALCINSGVFYVRQNSRTLRMFMEFLEWQYEHIFADNQNGADAFLGHSCADSYIPTNKDIRFGLLDVERSYVAGEGWNGPAVHADGAFSALEIPKATSPLPGLVLFHFWTSDFSHKNTRRDGSPIRGKKKDYFRMFFPVLVEEKRDENEITALLEDLRYQRFLILEKCAVVTTGINELIEHQNPNIDTSSLKPDHQEMEMRRQHAVAQVERNRARNKLNQGIQASFGVESIETLLEQASGDSEATILPWIASCAQ